MSQHPVETPDVNVKTCQGGMISYWALRKKIGVVLLALAVYVYALLFAKTMYLKSQRLDFIADMATETERMIRHVREIDRNFMLKIEYLDDLQGDSSY